MIRYAITDGDHVAGNDRLLLQARLWSEQGIEFVQLREKHLNAGEQVRLAREMMRIFDEDGGATRLLINHRVDVAIAAGAGVHLRSSAGELTPQQVKQIFAACGMRPPLISASCHTSTEVSRAATAGVDLILFGPVFEKRTLRRIDESEIEDHIVEDGFGELRSNGLSEEDLVIAGTGLRALREACTLARNTPVLALGGVTNATAAACMNAGAAGVAGIRIFASATDGAQRHKPHRV